MTVMRERCGGWRNFHRRCCELSLDTSMEMALPVRRVLCRPPACLPRTCCGHCPSSVCLEMA